MIIGIFGVSGVGKTTLTNIIKRDNNSIKTYSASDLIKKEGGKTLYSDINKNSILSNQNILIQALQKLPLDEVHLIEFHNIIETKNETISIDNEILKSLDITSAYFIHKNEELIINNRKNDFKKERPTPSKIKLAVIQKTSINSFNLMKVSHKKTIIYKNHENMLLHLINDDITLMQ